jgi:predicted RNA methylase
MLIKLLEGEDVNSTIKTKPVLPDLSENIFFGNSLLNPKQVTNKKDQVIINPFDFSKLRFDVIVGNPPFQNRQENSDSAFWLKFVNKGMSLLATDGKLCFVSPRSWVGKVTNTSKADFTPFTDNHVELYKPLSEDEKKKYFDGVGSSFGYYIISNGQGLTEIIFEDGTSITHQLIKGEPLPNLINKLSFSIHGKIAKATKFDFKSNFKFHSQVLKKKNIVSDTKSTKFSNTTYYSHNLIRYTSTQQDIYSDSKVMIPNVGRLSNAWVDSNCNLTEDVRFAIVKNKTQGDRLVKLIKSPLYSYIGSQYRSGINLGKGIDFLPELNLTQTWTNDAVYNYFKLTKQEIEYVESHTE